MGFKIRIRTAFIIALLAIGLIPLSIFAWYSYERTLAREFEEVNDRHLLLAQNLSSTLSRYEKDVRAAIRSVAASLDSSTNYPGSKELLQTLHVEQISLIDTDSGTVTASMSALNGTRTHAISASLLAEAADAANPKNLTFLPVQNTSHGNIIHVVGLFQDKLVIACLGTKYFVELGKQISFGAKGHAAIVDQSGNVLAHPLPSWIAVAKNISKVSAVRRMMNGETGIEQFYSPALKGDMIAGLTSVQGPGWGVMIPQPVQELYAKAFENLKPIFFGLILSVFATLLLVKTSINWLARPLENLTIDLKQQSLDGEPAAVPPDRAPTNIYELQGIIDSYNDLAMIVQNSATELAERAFQDAVTGIGNRSYFTKRGKTQINRRTPLGKRGVLIFTDLDGFKEINDVRGHAAGDQVLQAFAKELYPVTKQFMDREFRGVAGAHPIIGRIGGDEFAILLPIPDQIIEMDDVVDLCARLRDSLPKSVDIDGITVPCELSAGGAVYPDHGDQIEDLIRRADVALYRAKMSGKNQFAIYSKENALGGKSEILSAVMHAIENDELILEYQPKFCVTNQKVTGVEALLRWMHPKLGRLPPNLFLPAVQQTNVMVKLGEWVINRATSDIKELEKAGHKLSVAVNIGAEHFAESDFVSNLVDLCKFAEFDPGRLQIEVTEDVMDASRENFKRTVNKIQKHGFSIAIDDFGKGFSNLSRLASVPVDVIKLDRSLVNEAVQDSRVHVITQSAIDMAHALGSTVVVEGVETLEEVSMAEKAGADTLQGFYFSKSLSVENLVGWLNDRDTNAQRKQLAGLQSSLAAS
ncbi:MAG: EAL domain-containing protein [Rhizobiaceae bacterium]|nr:EAL domain-containing protein [Rhizobiaceae bacterium]